MYQVPQITDSVYYVGVNDRMKERFENVWSIPSGVAYNAYLIVDEKTTLIDTVDVCYSDIFFHKLDLILQGRPVDYLIINHWSLTTVARSVSCVSATPICRFVGNKRPSYAYVASMASRRASTRSRAAMRCVSVAMSSPS